MKLIEFISLLEAADRVSEWQMWLDAFRKKCGSRWPIISNTELTRDVVIALANEVVEIVRARLDSVCTEALYNRLQSTGHALLQKVAQFAQENAIKVKTEEVDMPITIVDFMRTAKAVIINDDGGVTLTQKGSRLADEVRQQVEGNV